MEIRSRAASWDDWLAIKILVQSATQTMPCLWHWEDHLAAGEVVVAEQGDVLVGALLACSDDSPVAWVRLAVVDSGISTAQWLRCLLPRTLEALRRQNVSELAWMDYGGWVGPHLAQWGFDRLTDVVTLVKLDRDLPSVRANARVRAVRQEDIPRVAEIDRAAFPPTWWNSETTLHYRRTHSSHFAVAEVHGRVVGFAEGDVSMPTAHLNRLAVDPAHQSQGIGALLLNHMVLAFWRAGANEITLNTQRDNASSLRLYHGFGFEPEGAQVTVWRYALAAPREG